VAKVVPPTLQILAQLAELSVLVILQGELLPVVVMVAVAVLHGTVVAVAVAPGDMVVLGVTVVVLHQPSCIQLG
jgi:hypothetical protein